MTQVKPLVSVLIRTLEHRRSFLARALASVNGQETRSAVEAIIVCDGGCIDRSVELQNSFSNISIKYIPTQTKVGRSEAANIALSVAQGDYINFLDDDDVFYSSHIELLSKILHDNSVFDAVYAGADKINVNIDSIEPLNEVEVGASYHYTAIDNSFDILDINPFPIQAIMFRSVLLTGQKFDTELDALEDWLFWQAVLVGRNIYGINRSTSRYFVPAKREEIAKRLAAHEAAYGLFKEKSDALKIPLGNVKPAYSEVKRRFNSTVPKQNRDFILKERLQRAIASPGWAIRTARKRIVARLESRKLMLSNKAESFLRDSEAHSKIENIFYVAKELSKGRDNNTKVAIYTSVNSAYLAKAILLGRSVKQYNNNVDFHIVYCDVVDKKIEDLVSKENCIDVLYPFRLLPIEGLKKWSFQRNVVELCTGVKPFYMQKLLGEAYDYVIYIDPDCRVFSSISPIIESIDRGSLSLTPHCKTIGVSDAQVRTNELSSLAHGIFNLGYIGVKNDEIGQKAAEFWKERVSKYGFDEIHRGLFTDQKFFDLAPVFFKQLDILEHSGVNVASWNLEGSPILRRNGKYYAGDTDLVFFHFSGFDKGVPRRVGSNFSMKGDALHELLDEYEVDVARVEHEINLSRYPWALGFFSNGAPIDESYRVCYRMHNDLQQAFDDPYSVSRSNCYWAWLQYKGAEYVKSRYDRSRWLPRFY